MFEDAAAQAMVDGQREDVFRKMQRLVYVSTATRPMSESDLMALLEQSRSANETDGVTGILLYRDGVFLQVLEGEQTIVSKTFDRIARDMRHTGVRKLLQEPIEQRDFPDWSMGFENIGREKALDIEGYSDVFEVDAEDNLFFANLDTLRELLALFHPAPRSSSQR